MNNKLVIKGEMTDLNTYLDDLKTHKFVGSKVKKYETFRVVEECMVQRVSKFDRPVTINYTIYTKDKRKDPDNLLIYIKFINDGLVVRGVIPNDSMRYVTIGKISVLYDGSPARTEIEII